jgi:hypothetical protein
VEGALSALTMLRDALSNANSKRYFGSEGFFDTGSGQWGARNIFLLDLFSGRVVQSVPEQCQTYGTKIAVAVAPVCFTASETLAKTGRPRCCWPAFFGFVPPTTLVPIEMRIMSDHSPIIRLGPAVGKDGVP